MDIILLAKDECVPLEKVKMKQYFYDEYNDKNKERLARAIDAKTILGVPIEIDDGIENEYEIIFKTLT